MGRRVAALLAVVLIPLAGAAACQQAVEDRVREQVEKKVQEGEQRAKKELQQGQKKVEKEALKARKQIEQGAQRSEEHTSELQSRQYLVCRLLLEKKKKTHIVKEKQQHY